MLSIFVIGLTAVVPGCAQEQAPTEPKIPADFTTYTDETELFSLSYPSDWEPALSLIADLEEAIKAVITSIELNIPIGGASAIFLAGLPYETGYMPNVNIVVEPLPGVVTHQEMVEADIRGNKRVIQDYHQFSRVWTTVGGREATIVELEGIWPERGKGHWLQMYILVGKTAWVITCTSTAEEFGKWQDDFNAIVRSLRILK